METHNNYVQQLHAANGMVDAYYSDTLPQLLQELDDVYHDVSGVVAETLIQGADIISLKVSKYFTIHILQQKTILGSVIYKCTFCKHILFSHKIITSSIVNRRNKFVSQRFPKRQQLLC